MSRPTLSSYEARHLLSVKHLLYGPVVLYVKFKQETHHLFKVRTSEGRVKILPLHFETLLSLRMPVCPADASHCISTVLS